MNTKVDLDECEYECENEYESADSLQTLKFMNPLTVCRHFVAVIAVPIFTFTKHYPASTSFVTSSID